MSIDSCTVLSFARCTDRDNAARSIMRFVVHLVGLYRRFGSRVEIDCKGNKEVFRKKKKKKEESKCDRATRKDEKISGIVTL